MGDVKKFPVIKGLSDEEIGFVIDSAAQLNRSLVMVQAHFEQYYNKKIPIDVLDQILITYKKILEDKEERLRTKAETCLLGKPDSELRILSQCIQVAKKKKLRYAVKTGDHDYEPIVEPNWKIILGILQQSHKIKMDYAKLDLARRRLEKNLSEDGDSSGSNSYEDDAEEYDDVDFGS